MSKPGGFRSRTTSAKRAPQQARKQRPDSSKKNSDRAKQHKTVNSKVDAPRQAAYDTLRQVTDFGAYANLTLPKLLRQRKIKDRDAAFATELTYGTLRNRGVLDAIIAECSSRPLEKITPQVHDALRLGAYQLLYMRVEPHAAVDTSVSLIEGNATGFANAILRTISRTSFDEWMHKLTPEDEMEAVAFNHAHPKWIALSFARALGGEEELEAALEADSARPVVHLVARPGEMTAEELALVTGGEMGTYSPYAVYLEGGSPGEIDPVRDGLASVQDEGSQLIARALVNIPVENDQGRWLDLCAGPGGKAALMGSLARIDGAHVDAVEIAEHRADLIRNSVKGLPVTIHHADGRKPELEPGFDRVLVDAPCSGLGALRRRPEARWRKQESDIVGLNVLQYQLLESAYNLVKPGGVVVYSTCSPDVRETREIVDRAIKELGAQEESAHEYVESMENVGEDLSVQMWPHRHGTDAMFFAVLRKPA